MLGLSLREASDLACRSTVCDRRFDHADRVRRVLIVRRGRLGLDLQVLEPGCDDSGPLARLRATRVVHVVVLAATEAEMT